MQAIKEIIPTALAHFQTPEALQRTALSQRWPELVGPKIAAHTRPALNKKERLCVWVDHPVLAFELSQKYQQALLKRVQSALGEDAVKSIRFKVGQLR